MHRILCLLVATLAGGLSTTFAQFIDIRISYKVILDPSDGARPSLETDAIITDRIARMNELLASYWRGYRLQQVGAIAEVGGQGDNTGPSRFYSVDFLAQTDKRKELEQAAMANPSLYQWRFDAINIYINMGSRGGLCSFPDDGQVVVIGRSSAFDRHLHEIGHFFNLYHTQGKSCGECNGDGACTSPGDDAIPDTLYDVACWNQNNIAMFADNFGQPYDSLSPANQERVNDVFFNVMSYHNRGSRSRMTERQLDRFTDAASGPREHVVSGETVFVDKKNSCLSPAGGAYCTLLGFGGPYPRLRDGVNAADPGGIDIVMIRPGNYNERFTINKAVTLRATRVGPVTIGR